MDNMDDEELWQNLDNNQETLLDMAGSRQHLSCFAHSLQLVIGDGLKEAKCISLAIAKHLSSLLHSSTTFKNRFKATFGSGSVADLVSHHKELNDTTGFSGPRLQFIERQKINTLLQGLLSLSSLSLCHAKNIQEKLCRQSTKHQQRLHLDIPGPLSFTVVTPPFLLPKLLRERYEIDIN
ncbi:hypothetical protein F2P79_015351 [Pimephales promelas]|nr:hypothetical protein F2P79_015351 [Pimephales promelas]